MVFLDREDIFLIITELNSILKIFNWRNDIEKIIYYLIRKCDSNKQLILALFFQTILFEIQLILLI